MVNEEVLVLGGAGYIGSHTCVELVEAGYKPIIVDSTINSSSGLCTLYLLYHTCRGDFDDCAQFHGSYYRFEVY